ncbi:hypothetical protein ACFZB5_28400 [Streptomyces nodosus]|uniref:hypothetical protein n=1 Tax=Streptomyces nodosus TaxID=40318 RepID=UPI0036E28539
MSRYEGGLDPWSRALGWWGDKGASARVELYTRWTFHCVALIQLLAVAGPVALSDGPGASRAVLATLLALHSGLTALTCSRALGSLLDHREPPMRLVAAHVALSGLVVVVAATLARAGTDPAQRSMAVAVALGPVIFGPMAPALVARPGRVAQLVLSFSVALVCPPCRCPGSRRSSWAWPRWGEGCSWRSPAGSPYGCWPWSWSWRAHG